MLAGSASRPIRILAERISRGYDEAIDCDHLERLRSALITLSPPSEWLRLVAQSGTALAVISRNAYLHSNGFNKLILAETNECELRLHVWFGSVNHPNIHDHTRDFASLVIAGQLTVCRYAEGTGQPHYLYVSHSGGRNAEYDISQAGQIRVSVAETKNLRPGDIHCDEHSTLHRAYGVAGEVTATIFLQGPRRASRARVVVDRPLALSGAVSDKRLRAGQVRELLRMAADAAASCGL